MVVTAIGLTPRGRSRGFGYMLLDRKRIDLATRELRTVLGA